MPEPTEFTSQRRVADVLFAKAAEHGTLVAEDEAALRAVRSRTKSLAPGEDIVRQGDRPEAAVLLLRGTLARYHTLPTGERQYLTIHIAGDMPDIQSLFLDIMDHSLCALDGAEVALLPHEQLCELVLKRPGVGFAFWRLTLVDAAIFRQAITNNSARGHVARLAHFFCEQFFRAREAKLVEDGSCSLPLSQHQLGQALGMSHISVNRALQRLRKDCRVEFRAGRLSVPNWPALVELAGFDPTYLHVAKESHMARTPFGKARR